MDQLILSDGGSEDSTAIFLSLFASDFPGIASVVHCDENLDRAARSALWGARFPHAVILPADYVPQSDFLHLVGRSLTQNQNGAQAMDLAGGLRVIIGPVADLLALPKIQVTKC
jgi:hypothetical protein